MEQNLRRKKPISIKPGDIIFYEEDVFVKKDNRHTHAGSRITIGQVQGPGGLPGELSLKVIKSAGFNAEPKGVIVSKPLSTLMRGWQLLDINFNDEYKSGGHLEGTKDGQPVQLDNASKGGMSVGSKHTEGGIKGAVGTEGKPIEFEGEEIILTAPVASNNETYEFEGKKMTGREIASKINVDNGGVSFAEGGEAGSCRCKHKEYKFGGQTYTDKDIINYINFMNKGVSERILLLKK